MQKSIILVFCAIALSAASQDYTCDTSNQNIVNFYDNKLTCPDGLVCNSKYKTIGTAKPKPCVAPSTICEYSCDANDNSKVTINLVTFTCEKGTKCNSQKTSCEVCEPIPCDQNAYSCNPDDDSKFILGGQTYTCPADTKCNSRYKFPCSPCLGAESNPKQRSSRNIFFKSFFA